MTRIQDFMVGKVQEMNATLLSMADKATRKAVEDFNEAFTQSVLDEIFHVFLHSIPAMARKITVSGMNITALRMLPEDHPIHAIPVYFGQRAFEAAYQIFSPWVIA